ncbi:MAG: hypothetical protein QOF51_2024 [Chloroflexota bacterium]|jgi:pimeloyl-ACP methyl ester carboxylesterase/DNA-binding CsgD family transcriptional regulator|nr:hypothetical protein [Chloroflexota bacterium]
MDQEIRFCTTADGARLAYAVCGTGPPLVLLPGWVSHLELNWPRLQPLLEPLTHHFQLIRYDKRGTGLSDRAIDDFSLDARLADFSCLMDHLGLARFAMYASSAGGPVAMRYAALHPEQVEALVLYGTFARGDGVAGKPQTSGALAALVRAEWGLAATALTELFIPGASGEERESFARVQRLSADAEAAAALLEATAVVDVRTMLPGIAAPTLVTHARGDRAVPFEFGREVAATIPMARLLAIESDWHALAPADERQLWAAVLDFLQHARADAHPAGEVGANALWPMLTSGLSDREVEVLRLIARGRTNRQIASDLVISLHTVSHHVGNILAKIGATNRTEAAAYAHRLGLLS